MSLLTTEEDELLRHPVRAAGPRLWPPKGQAWPSETMQGRCLSISGNAGVRSSGRCRETRMARR